MPQMMPLNWMILFLLFSLNILFIIMNNFYFSKFKPNLINNNYKNKNFSWKW